MGIVTRCGVSIHQWSVFRFYRINIIGFTTGKVKPQIFKDIFLEIYMVNINPGIKYGGNIDTLAKMSVWPR